MKNQINFHLNLCKKENRTRGVALSLLIVNNIIISKILLLIRHECKTYMYISDLVLISVE